jgi:glycogen(starch) synthase
MQSTDVNIQAMKVLMTTDAVGGVWSYALELARALEPFDIEVALATMGAVLNRAQRAQIKSRPNVTVFEGSYRLEWMPDAWKDVQQAGAWLLKIAADIHPDVVHLNGYTHGALPWPAPVLIMAHSCVLSWWQAVHDKPAPLAWASYRQHVARGLHGSNLVVAPTHVMLAALEQQYGALPLTRVIPNARDPKAYTPARKEPLVLTAGRLWDEAKNVQALVRAAAYLPWPVIVAGDTQHPFGETVAFSDVQALGRLSPEALAGWYARAAIYALPARYEPFGLSALEAALCGCALVLGDIPSLREVWADTSVFVPPDDHRALRVALEQLIESDVLRARYAAKARTRALQFAPQRMGAAYHAIYRELAAAWGDDAQHLAARA